MARYTTTAHRHNVTITDTGWVPVSCTTCSETWQPMLGSRGRLPRRWWLCPQGCNDPAVAS